jgi:hypothetical protein
MGNSEPLLPIAWERTKGTRRSAGWWIAAVLCGASLGVAAYYAVPSDSSWLWALASVVAGFFLPYVLAVLFGMPLAALQDRSAEKAREAEWAKVGPVVRRTR